jgi:hypothetical protein
MRRSGGLDRIGCVSRKRAFATLSSSRSRIGRPFPSPFNRSNLQIEEERKKRAAYVGASMGPGEKGDPYAPEETEPDAARDDEVALLGLGPATRMALDELLQRTMEPEVKPGPESMTRGQVRVLRVGREEKDCLNRSTNKCEQTGGVSGSSFGRANWRGKGRTLFVRRAQRVCFERYPGLR